MCISASEAWDVVPAWAHQAAGPLHETVHMPAERLHMKTMCMLLTRKGRRAGILASCMRVHALLQALAQALVQAPAQPPVLAFVHSLTHADV
mmetsp:Transcript_38751/g.115239  ORF Transcript_38751/g.115239 Transcript_38751/m.115239 type:complete len:92 (-) Transcript_38751:104-379(-)